MLSFLKNLFHKEQPVEESSFEGKTVVGGFPSGTVVYRFVPTETFYSEETGSMYVRNMKYSVREGNEKLDKLARKWRDNKKVVIL